MGQIPLYVSVQTDEYTVFRPPAPKTITWREDQRSSVTISVTGQIECTITDFGTLGDGELASNTYENETKTFMGEVVPIKPWPAAGTTSGVYKVSGSYVNDSKYDNEYEEEFDDTWENWNFGSDKREFEVISIKVEAPNSILCYVFPVDIEATSYPEEGGEFEWKTESENIELVNADKKTVTVKFKGPVRGIEDLKVKFTIEGVSYEHELKVDTRMPKNQIVSRTPYTYTQADRNQLGWDMIFAYFGNCKQNIISQAISWCSAVPIISFPNAGPLIASNSDVQNAMKAYYDRVEAHMISKGLTSRPLDSTFSIYLGNNLEDKSAWLLATSTYNVKGNASIICDESYNVIFKVNVIWTVSDEIDGKGPIDVYIQERNAGSSWWEHLITQLAFIFSGEMPADALLDKFFDCNYSIKESWPDVYEKTFSRSQ
jgi:hypothetical protein